MKFGLLLTLAIAVRSQGTTQSCLDTGCGANGICVDLGNNNYRCNNAATGTFSTGCHVVPCVDGTCVNQPDGSAKCVCGPGKELQSDGKTCLPAVENCPTKPCKDGTCQTGANMVKSCVCNQGYTNSVADPTICVPDTSGSTTEDCRVRACTYGVCASKGGVYTCQCIQGYTVSATNKSLCEPDTSGHTSYDPCKQVYCVNGQCRPDRYGYGRCVCYPGYRQSRYQGYCERIYTPPPRPTCATYPCDFGYCVQSPGGHLHCRCYPGYQIDPNNHHRCQLKPRPTCATYPCEYGQCAQSHGGHFHCECYQGYQLDPNNQHHCQLKQTQQTNTWNPNNLASQMYLQYLLEEM